MFLSYRLLTAQPEHEIICLPIMANAENTPMRTLYKNTISEHKNLTYFAVEVDKKNLYISTTIEQEGHPGCLMVLDLPLWMAREIRAALDELDGGE